MESKADIFRDRIAKNRFSDTSLRSLIVGIVILLVFFASGIRFGDYLSLRQADMLSAGDVTVADAEISDSLSDGEAVSAEGAMININTAGSDELQTLSGIGPAKAQAIIDHRDNYGNFVTKKQIMDVSGIGQATYEKLEAYICVE